MLHKNTNTQKLYSLSTSFCVCGCYKSVCVCACASMHVHCLPHLPVPLDFRDRVSQPDLRFSRFTAQQAQGILRISTMGLEVCVTVCGLTRVLSPNSGPHASMTGILQNKPSPQLYLCLWIVEYC